MAMGALGGLSYYGAYSAITDRKITVSGIATAAVSGAISGAVGYGVGKIVDNVASKFSNRTVSSNFSEWLNNGEKNCKVYFGVSENGTYDYVGITKQPLEARLAQHKYNGKELF